MWQQLVVIVLIGLSAEYARAARLRFDNYPVYGVVPNTTEHLKLLSALDGSRGDFMFVTTMNYVGYTVLAIVEPKSVDDFVGIINKTDMAYWVVNKNAQNDFNAVELVADPKRTDGKYKWTEYHELDDTYNWMRQLTKKYPKQASTFVAGKSYEGRELLGVKISYGNQATSGANKRRSIFIEAGIHAREWIAPATATFIINQLLTSKDENVRKIAENYVWYILPHTNPDGYVYTHTTNRFWRKTRTPYGNCFGADPNRNWGLHWNQFGSNNGSCSEEYAGSKAFSEVETRTLSEYLKALKNDLVLYLTFHSASQMLLFPYGYTQELPPNYENLNRIHAITVAAAKKRYGTVYTGGNMYSTSYPVSGGSVDWVYGELKVPYAYSFELRHPTVTNEYAPWTGFLLPAEQIIPTGEEMMDALLAMVGEISATVK